MNGNSKLITDKQLEEIRTAIQAEALSQQNPEDNLQNRIKRPKTVPEDTQDSLKTASQNNLLRTLVYIHSLVLENRLCITGHSLIL